MRSCLHNRVHAHVSEVYSPKRVTALGKEYGLIPGTAFDLTTNAETCNPCNFDVPAQRATRKERLLREKH